MTYNINWGDGQTQSVRGGANLAVSHIYAREGSYSIEVMASDAGGLTSTVAERIQSIGIGEQHGTRLAS